VNVKTILTKFQVGNVTDFGAAGLEKEFTKMGE
jgi:hypothetical protein